MSDPFGMRELTCPLPKRLVPVLNAQNRLNVINFQLKMVCGSYPITHKMLWVRDEY